jgi:hypothetical protein
MPEAFLTRPHDQRCEALEATAERTGGPLFHSQYEIVDYLPYRQNPQVRLYAYPLQNGAIVWASVVVLRHFIGCAAVA